MSIGYANICSSVQDHRQKFEIIIRLWKNKREQRNQWKASLKRLKRTAPEVKVLLKWWRHQKQVHQKHLIRSWRSPEAVVHQKMQDLKLQRLFHGFNIIKALQKTEKMKQRLIQMHLKALYACSLKSVDKVQLYEVYNHYLHNSVFVSAIRQK